MAFLTVLIDDHQAQASIIIKSTIEEISNPFGGNVFYGEHLLNDPVVLANVLKDIQKAAASMTRNVLDEKISLVKGMHPTNASIDKGDIFCYLFFT